MFKTAVLIRKNPALTVAEFREHYETKHAPLAASLMPKLRRYTRHFATAYGNATYSGGDDHQDLDVITEMWFDSEADFQEAMAHLSQPEVAAVLGADEERVFDRSSIRIYLLEDSGDAIN
ncbi:EthD domain-containing protein [Novosphingobium sp. 9U]|uniref:EthD domain-containing protein n=1 Tax=Novosphingobium sp. 9U TaxID=2653158 RepID=UPI0012F08DA2|nr:EthD domain-containing protein [Novosphingobium sp. 9U]VWX49953.1 Ethyl tert-butyl ether degradation EthD [Novosphingobium sp. 9U]